VRVVAVAGDVTDPAACARAVAAAKEIAPLTGVFHLSGMNEDQAFERITPASFSRVFAAKARGAETLANALKGEPIQSLILFSSVSSAVGSAGQVSYAAANGYLDGFARALRMAGVPATAVAWGPWVPTAKGGMAASSAATKAAERLGIRPLNDTEAARLVALAAFGPQVHLIAIAADFARFAAHIGDHPRAALISALATAVPRETSVKSGPEKARGWLRDALASSDADHRDDTLRSAIRALVGEAIGDAAIVDDASGFAEIGLDSIMAIDLRTRLSHELDIDLPATVAIDHPNVAAMARFLADLVFEAEPPVVATPPKVRAAGLDDDNGDLSARSFEDLIKFVQDDLAETE
jgi:acyl carrier protein